MNILVIEDDTRIAALVDRALREGGHRVTICYDGSEGADVFHPDSHPAAPQQTSIMSEDSERICTFNGVGRSQIDKGVAFWLRPPILSADISTSIRGPPAV
jgi:CheY-like chemotaxis protein